MGMDNSRISVAAWIYPSEKMIRSHVYDDGRAVINIENHSDTDVQIWVGNTDTDLAAERVALLKLASIAVNIADHLDGLIAAREMAAQAVQS